MIRYSRTALLTVAVGCRVDGGAAQYTSCNGTVADIGNGRCDTALNVPACGFDGGDCCPCTCSDGPTYSCSDSDVDCIYLGCDDPSATSDETTCDESVVSDGRCDLDNNHAGCSWDGGDVSLVFAGACGRYLVTGGACSDGRYFRACSRRVDRSMWFVVSIVEANRK